MSTTRDPHRLDGVRSFNKHVLNPMMRTVAGRRYWYASALHHTGRRSGRTYLTPVVAEPVADGFLIPLPYGTCVDWLRNIRTAGHATIDVHGRRFLLADFRVIDENEALPLVRAGRRGLWRRLRIKKFLHARGDPAA